MSTKTHWDPSSTARDSPPAALTSGSRLAVNDQEAIRAAPVCFDSRLC